MSDNVSRLIEAAAKEALVRATEDALKIGKEHLLELSSSVGGAIFASITGNLMMTMTLGFLKHFLATETGIGRLEQKLNTLLQGPFHTAIEEFRILTLLEPKSQEELAFRTQRALHAQLKLDEAFGLSDNSSKPVLNLLRGLTALLIAGGAQEAKLHLDAYSYSCFQRAASLEGEAAKLESRASQLRSRLSSMQRPSGPGIGGGFAGSARALEHLEYREVEYDSNRLEREARQKRAELNDLRLCASIAKGLADRIQNNAQQEHQANG